MGNKYLIALSLFQFQSIPQKIIVVIETTSMELNVDERKKDWKGGLHFIAGVAQPGQRR